MIYGSVCSGIEAATAAWHPLGWSPAFFSEIEKFPREVLQHHYPETPLHGDFTTIGDNDYGSIDLLVGGTPCQSFSIAGLRKGLNDERGNLALEYLKLAKRKRPRWLVWENVPGVLSSNGGRDFGAFLGGLVECGYQFSYRVLNAQYFGVPQRRRRVFVVGYLGDWRPAAAVLFERHSMSGYPAPSREKREEVTRGVASCLETTCHDYSRSDDFNMIVEPASTLVDKHVVCFPINTMVMQGRPSDKGRLGLGIGNDGDPANTITKAHGHAIAFKERAGCEGGGKGFLGKAECAFTLSTNRDQAIACDIADTLSVDANQTTGRPGDICAQNMQVRRLTPTECERLQGFPDGYTDIRSPTPDGPRYKALGNSMAVPVMRWIGERIEAVEKIL